MSGTYNGTYSTFILGVSGTNNPSGDGGDGQAGVVMTYTGVGIVTATGTIVGGKGGTAGDPPSGISSGGRGGYGLYMDAFYGPTTLVVEGKITGGAGGDGFGDRSIGGLGGGGLYISYYSSVTVASAGRITGGASGGGDNAGSGGGNGVLASQGSTLVNNGVITGGAAKGAFDHTGGEGVVGSFYVTLLNNGTISGGSGGGSGVYLVSGHVSNSSTGVIKGADNGGVGVGLYSGTVVNDGLISAGTGGGAGVNFGQAYGGGYGTLTNNGTINGGDYASWYSGDGVYIGPDVVVGVTNSGVINGGDGRSGGDGVHVEGVGVVINTGVINGGVGWDGDGAGVRFAYGGTLSNLGGTISGGGAGDAVNFGFGSSRLIVGAGAVFNGNVAAYGSNTVIELLAGNGTLGGGIGTQFTGFNHLQVNGGGHWDLSASTFISSVTNNGTIVLNDASLTIQGSLDGTGVIEIDPTTLTLNGAVGSGQTIDFDGGGNLLNIGGVTDLFDGHITGFVGSDTIDLTGFSFDGITSAYFDSNTGVLTITTSGGTFTIDFDDPGNFSGQFFHLAEDGDGSILITQNGDSTNAVACYCPGTLIAGERGDVAIEDLKIGDRVLTKSGESQRIKWIGRRSYDGQFVRGNRDILPVRIAAGALGENLPRRDLVVSPLHAMFIDGLLIPAIELVNGTTIVQERDAKEVHYVHLELEAHDVIFAEGALSETFVDDDSRRMFENASEYDALHPGEPRKPARYCAPRVTDGYEIETVRARIARRAGLKRAA